jgi:hypothetical protein
MTERKVALLGSNMARVNGFTPLDEYESYNSTDDEGTPRGIEGDWNNDGDVIIRGNLVYTMPEVSAELRRREH